MMKEKRKKIGEMLLDAGLIDDYQLSAAIGDQRQWGGRLCSVLVRFGFVSEKTVASFLEKQLGEKCISLAKREISPEVLRRVTYDIADKYNILPLEFERGVLTIAISDPTDFETIDTLGFMLGARIKPILALELDIRRAVKRHYEGVSSEGRSYKASLERVPEDVPLTRDERTMVLPRLNGKKALSEQSGERNEITSAMMVKALMGVLIEKGLITEKEIERKLRERG
jgi:type IV pilus assembly protein PilB